MPMSHEPCTLFWPRTGARPLRGLPMCPVISASAAMARTVCTPCACCVTPMPQPTTAVSAVA